MDYMKTIKNFVFVVKYAVSLILLCVLQSAAWAQEKGAEVNVKISKSNDNWYAQPWVWIVGAAVFILLLVALLRGNKSSA